MELDDLQKQDYEVIADKTLSNQDHLFKLIIIGDTGKRFILLNSNILLKNLYLRAPSLDTTLTNAYRCR
jgi:hypothetical protein